MLGPSVFFARVTLLSLVGLAACGDGEPKGSTSLTEASEGSGSGEGSTAANTTGEPTSGGSTAAGSTGEAPVCEVSPDDSPCTACNNMNCCAQIEKCQAEPACECMTGCVTGLADIAMCTEKCGTSTNFSPLTQCGILNCASECT